MLSKNNKKRTKLLCHNSISVRISQCCVSMRQVCVENHDLMSGTV